MTKKRKKKVPGILYIIPGLILIAIRFIGENDTWSVIDIIKVGLGILMIGYGIVVTLKK